MEVEERRKIGLKYLKTIDGEVGDEVIKALDGVAEDIGNYHMGMTAENISSKYSITRGEMDKYAVESHQKATYTTEYGGFKKEIADSAKNGYN